MTKIPNFEEFRTAGSRTGSDYIGITKNGAISLYSGFYQKNDISQFSKCLLLWDKNQSLIGIQFGGEELGEGIYTVRHDKNSAMADISAKTFFVLNELNPEEWYGKYPPIKHVDLQRKNVFYIDFEQKIPIIRAKK